MLVNQTGSVLYKVLAVVFILALATILYLPQVYDLNSREKTEQCISNMKEVKTAVEAYIRDRNDYSMTTSDLIRTKYLRIAEEECPEGNVGDKYQIIVDRVDEFTTKITIQCPNVATYHDHILVVNN